MEGIAPQTKAVVITGGIGGAKFVEGLYRLLQPRQLAVIPNVGDDDAFHGLWVSPDVDTLVYTLSDRVNRKTGWGIAGDTFYAQEQLALMGQEVWMNLGTGTWPPIWSAPCAARAASGRRIPPPI